MRFSLVLPAILCLASLGCQKPVVTSGPNDLEADGLRVQLDVPRQAFVVGESFKAVVTITNTTSQARRIEATTGAPVYLRLSRQVPGGWETVKRFPEITATVMNPWTLEPGAKRTFEMNLSVEPDWPTYEPLRLSAEVNGVAEPRPAVEIQVVTRTAS